MVKRIKTYCIILTVIYLAIFTHHIYTGIHSFMSGMEIGKKSVVENKNIDILHLNVQPLKGMFSFPEHKQNIKNNSIINTESLELNVMASNKTNESYPLNITIFKTIRSILTFVYLGIVIYIPFLFFSIIRHTTKNYFIDNKIIKKINRMGVILVSIFVFNFIFFNLGDIYIAKQLIEIKDYTVVPDYSDYPFLILGIIVLLLSEILKISLKMKEEQDLTI